jgi:FixJ family two-component response regulator
MDAPGQPSAAATVIVIDDDPALLGALKFDLELEGFRVIAHASGGELQRSELPSQNGCLVIDYRLPGTNGLDLLAQLRKDNVVLPAILITSQVTEAVRSRTKTLGGFIVEKPLLGDVLLRGIRTALAVAAK